MKKILTLLVVTLLSSSITKSQVYEKVLSELNLPLYRLNEKPLDGIKIERDGELNNADIKISDNPLVDEVTLSYDDVDELKSVSFHLPEKKIKKTLPKLLEVIRSNYGPETDIRVGVRIVTTTYYFKKDNQRVMITIYPDKYNLSSIYFYLDENIKLKEKYDEFNKFTMVSTVNTQPSHASTTNDLYYQLSFKGFLPSKTIILTVTSDAEEWKFMKNIQILVDGNVYNYDLKTSKQVMESILGPKTLEIGVADIPKEVYQAMIKKQPVKIRINGDKRTGDIVLNQSVTKSLILLDARINESK
jgi:hypothetical protein